MRIRVTLYGKPNCSLCDAALARVRRAGGAFPIEIEQVNIEEDPGVFARFKDRVPVVALDGEVALEGKISDLALRRELAARSEMDNRDASPEADDRRASE